MVFVPSSPPFFQSCSNPLSLGPSGHNRLAGGGVLFGNGTLPLFSGAHLMSTGYFYSFKAGRGDCHGWRTALSCAQNPWLWLLLLLLLVLLLLLLLVLLVLLLLLLEFWIFGANTIQRSLSLHKNEVGFGPSKNDLLSGGGPEKYVFWRFCKWCQRKKAMVHELW